MSTPPIAIDETATLIASDKVAGQSVYNRENEHLGSIHNFMVNKRTGQVEYAVLSFGGFLGLGSEHYPLPWSMLVYDEYAGGHGGYIVDLDKAALTNAPRFEPSTTPAFDDAYNSKVMGFYATQRP